MGISMAVFGGEPFTEAAQIRAIDKRPYKPNMLDSIIQFEPVPVNTDSVFLGSTSSTIALIRTTLRGAPLEVGGPDQKNVRPFKIPRLAKARKLFAHELANLAPLDGETDEDAVARRIARMQEQNIEDLELTEEYHRLGALSGIVYEPDGTTVITNFYTEFGIAPPSAVDLTLDNTSMSIGELREKIGTLLVMPIARASGAGNSPRFRIRALCGDNFWFKLTGHPALEKTYQNWAAAADLRGEQLWESFMFAGVEWFHYRGTDDGTTVAISTNTAKVFPVGVPGMFQHVMGPNNESLATMGQDGRRYYPFLEEDTSKKKQWVQPEIYAYPLFFNGRPDLVLTATI